jgi:hypothetical protein
MIGDAKRKRFSRQTGEQLLGIEPSGICMLSVRKLG